MCLESVETLTLFQQFTFVLLFECCASTFDATTVIGDKTHLIL